MKNKPILSIGNRNYEILKYMNNYHTVSASDIYTEFDLNGNGIFIKQLLEKKLINRISRGKYQITKEGTDLINLLIRLGVDDEVNP